MPGTNANETFITGTYSLNLARNNGSVDLPADISDALAPEFVAAGFTHVDGAKFTTTPTLTEYEVTEAIGPIDARVTKIRSVMELKLAQYTKTAVNAAYGGGTWTTTATGSRYDPPSVGGSPAKYCVVLLPVDGDNKRGIVLQNAIAGGAAVEQTYKQGDMTFLPVQFLALASSSGGQGWYQLTNETAATDPSSEVQTIAVTGTPTGGTFTITFDGQTTAAIPYNAAASAVQTKLVALSNINSGDVTCTGGPLPGSAVTVTFGGALAGENVPAMTTTDSLTGGTAPASAITTGTAGGA